MGVLAAVSATQPFDDDSKDDCISSMHNSNSSVDADDTLENRQSPRQSQRILIVEDEAEAAKSLEYLFKSRTNSVVDVVSDGGAALDLLMDHPYSVCVTDIKLPSMDGLELLDHIPQREIDTDVIVLTGYGNVSRAVKAMKMGAKEFLTKPFDFEHLLIAVNRILEDRRVRDELSKLRATVGDRDRTEDPLRVELDRSLPRLLAEATAEIERRYLTKALVKTRGHIGRCAEVCGLSRRSISAKLAVYGIDKSEFKVR